MCVNDYCDEMELRLIKEHVYRVKDDVILRPLLKKDAEASLALINKNRKRLSEWLFWVKHVTTLEHELTFIKETQEQLLAHKAFQLGIFTGANSEKKCSNLVDSHPNMIGMCGFVDISNNCGVMGYWIDEDCSAKGIVTSSCKVLIEVGLDKLKLENIKLEAQPRNLRSIAVANRLNFKTDGSVHKSSSYDTQVLTYHLKKD